jgi:hypothetical protein
MTTLAALFLAAALQAPEKDEKPAPRLPSFFRNSDVDFWGEKAAQAKKKAEAEKSVQESIWAEPTRLPDGRTGVYLPPKAVLQFLGDPSRETGKEYVAWQEERMKRLRTAMEILRDLQAERDASKASAETSTVQSVPLPAGEILYFKKAGCPWCAKEDEVLGPFMRAHAGLRIRTIGIGESPDLAQSYGVSVVPTLIIQGRSGRSLALRGFAGEPQILSALQEVNREP